MSRKKILLIDDDVELVELIKLRFLKSDYDIVTACDGKEGYEKSRNENPDLIVLDLGLPKVDGYWVCDLLKKDKKYSRIPIIVITGRSGAEYKGVAKECGADDYVTKPFDHSELLVKIKKLLPEK